ncbi:MAG: OmpA family protein [Alphaproteobacteria bacterium]
MEGHTSDEAFSSPMYPSNWELSSARAAAVARFMEKRGIPRVRLKVVGLYDVSPKYPKPRPLRPADSAKSQQKPPRGYSYRAYV